MTSSASSPQAAAGATSAPHVPRSDVPFYIGLGLLSACYIVLIAAMLLANLTYASPGDFLQMLRDENIQYSIRLSLISSTITTILALWVAVPVAYLLSRVNFRGKSLVEAVLDIPIVLPPLVIGLCLLILFRQSILRPIDDWLQIAFHIPAVILAQFAVVTAFAIRALRGTFEEMSPRQEQVALTLGCSRSQAFWMIVLPEARYGLLSAATLAWARALGEFGPVLVFAGSTRQRTEVLPTSIYLELNVGHVEGAVAVSLLMILIAVTVLVLVRSFASPPRGAGRF